MAPLDNSRFGEILQKSPLYPFFVFLFWKNEPLNLVIFSQVRKWYNNEDRLGQFAPLFYFVRNIDELPVHPGLKVDYYPSLVFVND